MRGNLKSGPGARNPLAALLSTACNSGGVPVAPAESPAAELRALGAWFRLAPKLWFRGYTRASAAATKAARTVGVACARSEG